jgi:hypothetical protein
MARTCALLTKNPKKNTGQKCISAYVIRNKKNLRILGFAKKRLRAFDEQVFWTPGYVRQNILIG